MSLRAPQPIEDFVDLLGDLDWRNKVLKDIQYSSKVLLWLLEYYRVNAKKTHPQTHTALKTLVSSLSLARRWMILFQWTEDVAECRDAIAEGDYFGAFIAGTEAVNDLLDDVVTLKKAGVVPAAMVPNWVVRGADIMWAISNVLNVYVAIKKYQEKSTKARKLIEAAGPQISGEATQAHVSADAHALDHRKKANKAQFDAFVATISLLKLLADCGQSIPSAIELESYPDLVDHSAGLLSGLLSTYKIWIRYQHAKSSKSSS